MYIAQINMTGDMSSYILVVDKCVQVHVYLFMLRPEIFMNSTVPTKK